MFTSLFLFFSLLLVSFFVLVSTIAAFSELKDDNEKFVGVIIAIASFILMSFSTGATIDALIAMNS